MEANDDEKPSGLSDKTGCGDGDRLRKVSFMEDEDEKEEEEPDEAEDEEAQVVYEEVELAPAMEDRQQPEAGKGGDQQLSPEDKGKGKMVFSGAAPAPRPRAYSMDSVDDNMALKARLNVMEWSCPACTYYNQMGDQTCTVCGGERVSGSAFMEGSSASGAEGGSCSTAEKGAETPEVIVVEDDGEKEGAGGGFGAAEAAGKWACVQCTLLNDAERQACEACGRKLEAGDPGFKAADDDETWSCSRCTLVNKKEDARCEACQNEKQSPWSSTAIVEWVERQAAAGLTRLKKATSLQANEVLDSAGSMKSDGGDDEEGWNEEDEATLNKFVKEFVSKKGPRDWRCRLCGKVHCTRGIIKMHLRKIHITPMLHKRSWEEIMTVLQLEKGQYSPYRRSPSTSASEGGMNIDDDEEDEEEEGSAPVRSLRVRRKRVRRRQEEDEDEEEEEEEEEGNDGDDEDEDEEEEDSNSEEDDDDDDDDDEEEEEGTRARRTARWQKRKNKKDKSEASGKVQPMSEEELEQWKQQKINSLLNRSQKVLNRLAMQLSALMAAHGIRDEHGQSTTQPEFSNLLDDVQLRDYQETGLRWLLALHTNRLNGILADEMGLGKTHQVIALFSYLYRSENVTGPFLVVGPFSVVDSWVSQFHASAPIFKTHQYHGAREERQHKFYEEVCGRDGDDDDWQQPCVVVTSYEMVLRDADILSQQHWHYVVVDEAHRLKKMDCQLLTALNQCKTDFRLLLTGTPLQNSLKELFSLLHFTVPQFFDHLGAFHDWFNRPFFSGDDEGGSTDMSDTLSDEEMSIVISQLHQVLRPFLLRRTKQEVLPSLPRKEERVVQCPLSSIQVILYRLFQRKMNGEDVNSKVISFNNLHTQLRKVCNHPLLLLGGSEELYEHYEPLSILQACGKFVVLDSLLLRLRVLGHRVLIFSQMTTCMDLIEDLFLLRGYNFLRLDGQTSLEERNQDIAAFNQEGSEHWIFLISTRAGGVGLNLQTADTVIIYDSDWNPHNDLQAIARVHRMGQTREVLVLRLASVGPNPDFQSLDEKMIAVANAKLHQEARVIGDGNFTLDTDVMGGRGKKQEQEALKKMVEENEKMSLQQDVRGSSADTSLLNGQSRHGSGASNAGESNVLVRWDLVSTDAMNRACARNDEEMARLQQEGRRLDRESQEMDATLYDNIENPPWLEEILRDAQKSSAPPPSEMVVVNGKRRRTARYESLNEKSMNEDRQDGSRKQVVESGSAMQVAETPEARLMHEHDQQEEEDTSDALVRPPCVACAIAGNVITPAVDAKLDRATCRLCAGTYHLVCVGLRPNQKSTFLCRLCEDEAIGRVAKGFGVHQGKMMEARVE